MHELRELIADRIRTSGPISFAEFMDLSLYHPEFGYYARSPLKTGRAGDFFTSVDVGSIFGALLAKQFAEMWRLLGGVPFDMVEAGAGSGRLARDILDAAQRIDPEFYAAVRVSLVEASPAARSAQIATLGAHAGTLAHSSASLPDSIDGVLYANELLDALPTHVAVMTNSGLREVFVDVNGPGAHRFVERFEEPTTPRLAEYLARAGAELRVGWRAEVNLAAEDWVATAAGRLRRGFLMLIDYGHDERELYGGSHAAGTLASFKSHAQPIDFLQQPGETDITAHVDLSAVTRAAEHAGLDVIARLDQTYFMLGLGLAELDGLSFHQRLALKTLLLPGGLGSTHKVLIFGRGVGKPALRGMSYRVRMT